MQAAEYRGLDDKGRPFTIQAAQAVQAKSSVPIVDIGGMAARIQLEEGPATITADRARYNIETQKVDVLGPILFTAADGYRLETSDVALDLNKHTAVSGGGVEGRMRLGRFTAGGMTRRPAAAPGRPHRPAALAYRAGRAQMSGMKRLVPVLLLAALGIGPGSRPDLGPQGP